MSHSAQLDAPVRTRTAPVTDSRPRKQPRYNVVLIDDDDHTYQYVICMLQSLFGYNAPQGYELACEIDAKGRAIILTTTFEHAEFKRDQIHSFGRDHLLQRSLGSMRAVLEPVE